MAFIQMDYLSRRLMRQVPVNVILPVDKLMWPGMKPPHSKPFKTLYLLHGILGDCTDWVVGTRIARYAEEHDLAVVMPSGENAFYIDREQSHDYYSRFLCEELVDLTRRAFPLSDKREDTFIGGLSMGGFGALRNGLKYSETFGNIVALSSAIDIFDMGKGSAAEIDCEAAPFSFFHTREYIESCFGDISKIKGSDKDIRQLVLDIKASGAHMPDIYMACGEDDGLLDANKSYADFLREQDVNVTFEVGPGDHEWDFWDTYIRRGIEWLPTENSGLGAGSGNIGE